LDTAEGRRGGGVCGRSILALPSLVRLAPWGHRHVYRVFIGVPRRMVVMPKGMAAGDGSGTARLKREPVLAGGITRRSPLTAQPHRPMPPRGARWQRLRSFAAL